MRSDETLVHNKEAEEIVNQNIRLRYLDIAKFFSIVFMVAVHVFWKLGSDFEDPYGYVINYVLGAFMAAPVFMTCMGVSFAYTKRNRPEQYIQRGISIMLLGYLLNVLRYLPYIIYEISEGALNIHEMCMEFIQGDILAFAGLAMILFGIMKKLDLSANKILLIACVMSVIGSLLPRIMSESIPLNAFAGLFIFIDYPEETYMCFPLFTWFIFPAFGYWFINKFKTSDTYRPFFRKAALPCLAVVIIGCLLEMKYSIFMMLSNSEYYHMNSIDAFISLCCVIFLFALFDYYGQHLSDRSNRFYTVTSSGLNLIYIVHWIIIGVTMAVLVKVCNVEFSNTLGTLLTIIILVVSAYLGVALKNLVKAKVKKNPNTILRFLQ